MTLLLTRPFISETLLFKMIKLYDPNGVEKFFKSQKEAASHIGVTSCAISILCRGHDGVKQIRGWSLSREFSGTSAHEERKRKFTLYDRSGNVYHGDGICTFAREHGLNKAGVFSLVNKKVSHYRGFYRRKSDIPGNREYAMVKTDKPCVYVIRCLANKRRYVGSTVDFTARRNSHLVELREGFHSNIDLQKDFERYGEGFFVIRPIIECASEDRVDIESRLITKFTRNGINIYNNCYLVKDEIEFIGREIFDKNGRKIIIESFYSFCIEHGIKDRVELRKAIRKKRVEYAGFSAYSNDDRKKMLYAGDNDHNEKLKTRFKLMRQDGKIIECCGIAKTAKLLGVKKGKMQSLINGRVKEIRGWTLVNYRK